VSPLPLPMKERMRTPRVLPIPLVLLAAGSMTERVPPVTEYPAVPNQSTFLVQKIMYDERGRPLFGDRLGSRPDTAGEQFTVVHAINDRPNDLHQ
jgi:hypothetical protein